jgi:transposase-like protein
VLPPDEGFSAERAAEVSYIYGVPVETLRAWRIRHRSPLGAKRPGAPRKNR